MELGDGDDLKSSGRDKADDVADGGEFVVEDVFNVGNVILVKLVGCCPVRLPQAGGVDSVEILS